MTERQPRLLQRSDWASHPTLWKGHVEGIALGTNVTILFYSTEEVGRGPLWHVHPYDEIHLPRGSRAVTSAGPESRPRLDKLSSVPRRSLKSSITSAPGAWTPPTFT